ncbi:hypothetical protein HK101_001972 [Irineochytrium annulatum]|nr:hypothetical protein HK101_001972 [Irineochytrium annulatum]
MKSMQRHPAADDLRARWSSITYTPAAETFDVFESRFNKIMLDLRRVGCNSLTSPRQVLRNLARAVERHFTRIARSIREEAETVDDGEEGCEVVRKTWNGLRLFDERRRKNGRTGRPDTTVLVEKSARGSLSDGAGQKLSTGTDGVVKDKKGSLDQTKKSVQPPTKRTSLTETDPPAKKRPNHASSESNPCRWCGSTTHDGCIKCGNCQGYGHAHPVCISLNSALLSYRANSSSSSSYGRKPGEPLSASNPCRYCGSTDHARCIRCGLCFGWGHEARSCPGRDWKGATAVGQRGSVAAVEKMDVEEKGARSTDGDVRAEVSGEPVDDPASSHRNGDAIHIRLGKRARDHEEADDDARLTRHEGTMAEAASTGSQHAHQPEPAEQVAAKVSAFLRMPLVKRVEEPEPEPEPVVILTADAIIDPAATRTIGNDRSQFVTLEPVLDGDDGGVTGRGELLVRDGAGNEITVWDACLMPSAPVVVLAGRDVMRAGFDVRMTMRDRRGPDERVVREWVHHLTWEVMEAEEREDGTMVLKVYFADGYKGGDIR